MVPVFDRHVEGVGARLRLRRGVSWKRSAQEIDVGRDIRITRNSWQQSDAGRKISRDDEPIVGGGDGGDDDDDDDDENDDDGPGGGLVASPFAFNPLTTPTPLALSSTTAPTLRLTTEAPTTTSSLAALTPTSSSSLLPSSSDDADAVNPEVPATSVVTVSSVVVLTTTTTSPSSGSSSTTETSSSIDSIATTCTTSSVPTAAFDNSLPSPTIFLDDTSNDDHHHSTDYGPPPGGLNPTAEDALISAGSIGAFILVCFICWMGWRMYKKSRRMRDGMEDDDDGHFSSPNALLAKIPYFGRNQRAWQDLDGRGSPSMYERSKSGIYSNEQTLSRVPSKQTPTSLPQLNTNVAYSNIHPFSASSGDTNSTRSAQSPQDLATRNAAPFSQQPSMVLPPLQTAFSPASQINNPFALPTDVTSDVNSAAQYGAGTMQTMDTVTSDRSRMPDPIYNQSELARQASTAYDPTRRAVYRASELSSISSGFGDGDIIVPPPPAALQQGLAPRPVSFAKSVVNRSEEENRGQRDTVYTTTSEDMPPRYRSVNSWVNQQTGRIQRQKQSEDDEDVPPVPSLPAEERYTMMMDDEEPRRYEDIMSPQPPVPALPTKSEAEQQSS